VAWWTGASLQPANLGEYLEAAGFSHACGAPAMAVEIENMNESLPAPANLVTEEVTDEDTLRTWNEVYTEVFEYPDFTREPWFRMLASLGLGPEQQWRHFLARLEGKPVATASLFLWAGVAGIADVTTLPEARRQGVGTEITLALLREARRLGYRVGTLFASEMGLPVYRQIGFRPYFRGNCYIWTPEEGDTEPLRSSLAPFGQGS
ncbi:MAG: GNAT family N-acetyltransferase, partial [Dehalococcoidia bacterium]